MGTKERQQRERDRLREAILTAARDLFVAEGYRNVSMRKIAERIEYSPAAIYSYFPSKDDIFFALAEEGFRLLAAAGEAAAESVADPLKRLRRGLWAFYEFSKTHPRVLRPDVRRSLGARASARTSSGSSSSRRPPRAPKPTSPPASSAGRFCRRIEPGRGVARPLGRHARRGDDRPSAAPCARGGPRRPGARPARNDARGLRHDDPHQVRSI